MRLDEEAARPSPSIYRCKCHSSDITCGHHQLDIGHSIKTMALISFFASLLALLLLLGLAIAKEFNITVYDQFAFKGNAKNVTIGDECQRFVGKFTEDGYHRLARSIQTHGNCVVLHGRGDCTGEWKKLDEPSKYLSFVVFAFAPCEDRFMKEPTADAAMSSQQNTKRDSETKTELKALVRAAPSKRYSDGQQGEMSVTLYPEPEFKGSERVIKIGHECVNFDRKFDNSTPSAGPEPVLSVSLQSECVWLFEKENCGGRNIMITPGHPLMDNLAPLLPQFFTIGSSLSPCHASCSGEPEDKDDSREIFLGLHEPDDREDFRWPGNRDPIYVGHETKFSNRRSRKRKTRDKGTNNRARRTRRWKINTRDARRSSHKKFKLS